MSYRSAGYELAGTLTRPANGAVAAGVLIVGGSGPIDRNGVTRLAAGRPPAYRQWAEALSAARYAVLRYDKRFLTHPGIDIPSFDQEAQIADALAGVAFLRSLPELAAKGVYVIGHSEGGTVATVLAEKDGRIAGLAVINTVQFPVDELLVSQLRANPAISQNAVDEVRNLLTKIKDGSFPDRGLLLGAGREYWAQCIGHSGRSRATLSELSIPVLLVQCLADETLPGDTLGRNLDNLRAVVLVNKNAQLRELRAHDHFGMLPGEQQPSPEFMRTLLDWLKSSR